MANNIIELVLKLRDEATAGLRGVKAGVTDFGNSVKAGTASALGLDRAMMSMVGRLASVATVGTVLTKIVSESAAGEKATLNFARAFDAFGASLQVPRVELERFAAATAQRSIFSVGEIQAAQTELVRFGSITGDTLRRVQQASLDLAATLGTDAAGAARMLGIALTSPETSARMLKQANIVLTQSQRDQIKAWVATGDNAKAYGLILDEVEMRTKNAAEASRASLGGALRGLKNDFNDLFQASDVSAMADVVNGVAAAVRGLSSAFGTLAQLVRDTAAAIASLRSPSVLIDETAEAKKRVQALQSQWLAMYRLIAAEEAKGSGASPARLKAWREELERISRQLNVVAKTSAQVPTAATTAPARAQVVALDELTLPARAAGSFLDELLDKYRYFGAQAKQASGDFARELTGVTQLLASELGRFVSRDDVLAGLREKFDRLSDDAQAQFLALAGKIKGDFADMPENLVQFRVSAETRQGILDEIATLDGTPIEIAPQVNLDSLNESWQQMNETVHAFTESFKSAWEGMIRTGKFSVQSFVQFLIAQLMSKPLYAAIDKLGEALMDAFSTKSGGGLFGGLLGGLFSRGTSSSPQITGMASGGRASGGVTLVGEEGPELVSLPAGARVFNQRQMAFAGGGNVTYAPSYAITISGAQDDEKMRAELYQFVVAKGEADKREIYDRLSRNGFGRMR